MLSLNGTFLIIMVSFAIFMLAMRAVFFEPVRCIKQAREQKLKGDHDGARQAADELAQAQSHYDDQLKQARAKSQSLVASLQTQARQEAAATIQKARGKAQEELDKRLAELNQWREETYHQLADERGQIVRTILHKIAGTARVPAGE